MKRLLTSRLVIAWMTGVEGTMSEVESKSERAGRFISDESGQDLIEYSLLVAFIALAGAAAIMGMSGSVNSIWSAANSRLAAPNSGS